MGLHVWSVNIGLSSHYPSDYCLDCKFSVGFGVMASSLHPPN